MTTHNAVRVDKRTTSLARVSVFHTVQKQDKYQSNSTKTNQKIMPPLKQNCRHKQQNDHSRKKQYPFHLRRFDFSSRYSSQSNLRRPETSFPCSVIRLKALFSHQPHPAFCRAAMISSVRKHSPRIPWDILPAGVV